VIETRGRFSMLEVALETGRKHQIRVHLQHLGYPIAGDAMYHSNPALAPRLMLIARHLEFDHPHTGKRAVFDIDLPTDVAEWWGQVRRS
jgi:23S rRNA pseudouridine1911/1915/1917 synthase